jgi:hypothetical protein
MAKHSIGLLAGLLLISAAAYWAKAEGAHKFTYYQYIDTLKLSQVTRN